MIARPASANRDRPASGRLANAPFIKIEATKFTEVGYVGRDVDTIIRDLVEMAIKGTARKRCSRFVPGLRMPPRIVLDVLLPPRAAPVLPRTTARRKTIRPARNFAKSCGKASWTTRGDRYRGGGTSMHGRNFAPPGMEELTQQIQGMFQNLGGGRKRTAS